jgi:hypothetical protein
VENPEVVYSADNAVTRMIVSGQLLVVLAMTMILHVVSVSKFRYGYCALKARRDEAIELS